ncbi:MAG: hypothetical protein ACOYOU_12615 [Kiritimatiellia bacterium]
MTQRVRPPTRQIPPSRKDEALGETILAPLSPTSDILDAPFISRRVMWALVLALTALGAALRFYHIGTSALLNDETLQLNGILQPTLHDTIQYAAGATGRPPLTFIVHRFWLSLAPAALQQNTDGLTIYLRVFEALYGIAAVGLTYWAFVPLLRRRAALTATALAATSYVLIWYSREIRGYILFYLLALIAFGFFLRILTSSRRLPPLLPLAGFTAASILGGYLHFNTFLAWPVFGLLFFVWEFHRRHASGDPITTIRWRYLAALAAAGTVIVLAMLPAMPLFLRGFGMVKGMVPDILRPDLPTLLAVLSRLGLGTGWQGWIWWGVVFLGGWQAFRLRRLAFAVSATWIFAPIIGYVYLVGMQALFARDLHKYAIFIFLGFLPFAALGVDQLAAWSQRLLRLPQAILSMTVVALLFVTALPIYLCYYQMPSSMGWAYKEIRSRMSEFGSGNILLENYYDLQYMRYYIPERFQVAAAPVYNNGAEFMQLHVREFLQRTIENDPLLVHYISGAATQYDANKDYGWRDQLFVKREQIVNAEGNYLLKKGLNLWSGTLDEHGKLVRPLVYANAPENLPAYCKRRGTRHTVGFGNGWSHFTAVTMRGDWQHYYVTDSSGDLYVCTRDPLPAKLRLTLYVSACGPEQQVRLMQGEQAASPEITLRSEPFQGVDYTKRQQFRQYIPFGQILRGNRLPANFPFQLSPTLQKVECDVVVRQPVTRFSIVCSNTVGILMTHVACDN